MVSGGRKKDIVPIDEVRIIPINHGTAPDPIKKFEMGRTAGKIREANLCEFCQRHETHVKRLIRGDENRPGICSISR
jgi:hypothetical protein